MRVAVGRFWTESSSMSPLLANRAMFAAGALVEGEEVLRFARHARTELGGFLAALDETGIEPVPLLAAQAACAGPIEAPFWTWLRGRMLELLSAAGPIDAVLIGLGLLSIAWGTIGALAQRDLRGLLAYSAIANAGFMALAVGSGPEGRVAAVFYAVVYAAGVMLIFASLGGYGTGRLPLDGLRRAGFGPLRALALCLGLLSLAGIPPAPGFWAKLAILGPAWAYAGVAPTIIAVIGGVDDVDRRAHDAREPHREVERVPAGVAAVVRHGAGSHRGSLACADDDAPLRAADQRGHGAAQRVGGGKPPPADQHRVRFFGDGREHLLGRAAPLDDLSLQAVCRESLARAVEHRRAIRRPSVARVHEHDGAAEVLTQDNGLLERHVAPRAPVESHEEAREHG